MSVRARPPPPRAQPRRVHVVGVVVRLVVVLVVVLLLVLGGGATSSGALQRRRGPPRCSCRGVRRRRRRTAPQRRCENTRRPARRPAPRPARGRRGAAKSDAGDGGEGADAARQGSGSRRADGARSEVLEQLPSVAHADARPRARAPLDEPRVAPPAAKAPSHVGALLERSERRGRREPSRSRVARVEPGPQAAPRRRRRRTRPSRRRSRRGRHGLSAAAARCTPAYSEPRAAGLRADVLARSGRALDACSARLRLLVRERARDRDRHSAFSRRSARAESVPGASAQPRRRLAPSASPSRLVAAGRGQRRRPPPTSACDATAAAPSVAHVCSRRRSGRRRRRPRPACGAPARRVGGCSPTRHQRAATSARGASACTETLFARRAPRPACRARASVSGRRPRRPPRRAATSVTPVRVNPTRRPRRRRRALGICAAGVGQTSRCRASCRSDRRRRRRRRGAPPTPPAGRRLRAARQYRPRRRRLGRERVARTLVARAHEPLDAEQHPVR